MQITHMQKGFVKILKQKSFGECHDLHLQSDTLLLADVFENFRNMSVKIYKLDPAKFISAPGLAWWQAALKKSKVKLDIWIVIEISLMIEKGIRGGICHSIHRYAKTSNKFIKYKQHSK